MGLLLPCNLIVYETDPGRSVVAAVAPLVTMGRVGNEALAPLGAAGRRQAAPRARHARRRGAGS